jgi:hypothetical protein
MALGARALEATQQEFDQAAKLVAEMTIPECPRAQAVSRALNGAILICRQYLREPDEAGLQSDLEWILPAIETFTGVLESKVPPTRVEALEGVLALMKAETGPESGEGIDVAQVDADYRRGA